MAKTKKDIKDELVRTVAGCVNYEDMIDRIAVYIVRNYKLKKVILTTTLNTEEVKDE